MLGHDARIASPFDALCATVEINCNQYQSNVFTTHDFEDKYKVLHFVESDRNYLTDLLGDGPCLLLVLKEDLSPIASEPRTEVCTNKEGSRTYSRITFDCKPVPFTIGRAIISEYMQWRDGSSQTAIDGLPFWVYCRQDLPERTVLLGGLYYRTVGSKTNVIRTIQCDECRIRDLPNIDQCIYQFQHRGSAEPEVNASATYDLLRPPSGDTHSSAIYIHARWPRPTEMLAPPGANAAVSLTFQINPGLNSSPVYSTWLEVQTLQRLLDLYTESANQDESSNQSARNELAGVPIDQLHTRLETFFSTLESGNHSCAYRNIQNTESRTAQACGTDLFIAHPANVRRDQDLDFLDRLWMLICENGWENNAALLSQVIAAVCARVQTGQLRPILHEDNPCVLAKLLRRMSALPQSRKTTTIDKQTPTDTDTNTKEDDTNTHSRADTAPESHSDSEEDTLVLRAVEELNDRETALRCVLEMGLEKTKRDVTHCLTHRGLATKEELAGLTDCALDLAKQLKRRRHLYLIYELVAAGSAATLTLTILREAVSALIKHYSMEIDEEQTLTPDITIECQNFSATERFLKTLCTPARFRDWTLNVTSPMEQNRSAVPGMAYSIHTHSKLPTALKTSSESDDEDTDMLSMTVDMGAITVHRYVEKFQVHSWSR